MKSVQKIDLGLTGYDELFMNDAERKENKLPRIYDVPISEIDDFPDHPFKVKVDEDMDQLVQSIKERGIITPVTLRPKEEVGESKNTIFRYIRLTELIPELLQLVDESRIAFRPAVELSYLKKEEQSALLEEISYTDATPSLAQAIKMKKFSNEGTPALLARNTTESLQNFPSKKYLKSTDRLFRNTCLLFFLRWKKEKSSRIIGETIANIRDVKKERKAYLDLMTKPR